MNLDFLHPYPRYGLAVALVDRNLSVRDLSTDADQIAEWAADSIERALGRFFLHTRDDPTLPGVTKLHFAYLPEADLQPGSKHQQDAKHGYYLAPHVATSNNAAGAAEDARKLRDLLRAKVSFNKSCDLKRSFAPLTSKVNNGRTSMANPKASLIEAAFTAIATLAENKPGLYANGVNHVIIPDLPLLDANGEHEPLLDFVWLFANMRQSELGEETLTAELRADKREYRRPALFNGNFPGAPRDVSLSALGVLAAIGVWAKRGEVFRGDQRGRFAERVLNHLSRNPLYIVSYDGTRQEHFGHHVVGLALRHELAAVLAALNRVSLQGATSFKDPKWALFRTMAGRFLQFFSPATFRDFLAFRAEYPTAFLPILEAYFMEQTSIAPDPERRRELVSSARAYGASLNLAAYLAAKDEREADEKKAVKKLRTVEEYKGRIMVQLESTALGARSPAALLAQLGGITGRYTGRDVDYEGGVFMEAVATGEVPLDEAKQLVTAFMRLRTNPRKADASGITGAENGEEAAEAASESTAEDELPVDIQQ
jgi:hypothetical protein